MIKLKQQNQIQWQLLQGNRRWVNEVTVRDPNFFKKLGAQRSPKYLWIGCSDNRVPANELLGLLPGELFVHRNIANIITHTDLNCLSVLQFAIDVLKIQHLIICGHYGCAGVQAVLTEQRIGLADNWLQHVRDIHQKYIDYFHDDMSDIIKHNLLCELNVLEQVINVSRTTIVTDVWKRNQKLSIYPLIYGINNGLLHSLSPTLNNIKECYIHLKKFLSKII